MCEVHVIDNIPKDNAKERFTTKDYKENIKAKEVVQLTNEVVATKVHVIDVAKVWCCNSSGVGNS